MSAACETKAYGRCTVRVSKAGVPGAKWRQEGAA